MFGTQQQWLSWNVQLSTEKERIHSLGKLILQSNFHTMILISAINNMGCLHTMHPIPFYILMIHVFPPPTFSMQGHTILDMLILVISLYSRLWMQIRDRVFLKKIYFASAVCYALRLLVQFGVSDGSGAIKRNGVREELSWAPLQGRVGYKPNRTNKQANRETQVEDLEPRRSSRYNDIWGWVQVSKGEVVLASHPNNTRRK